MNKQDIPSMMDPAVLQQPYPLYAALRENALLNLAQSQPGSVEHGAHAAVALRYVPPLRLQEINTALNLADNIGQREHIHPAGSQFDGQRHALQKTTDARQDDKIVARQLKAGLNPVGRSQEELNGGVLGRFHRPFVVGVL